MFWGYFSDAGLGPLHPCVGTVNTSAYISIMEHQLLPTAACWFENIDDWIFVQDNAPCHNSKTTKKWFADKGVCLMEWPANSPDLNPIENLWGVLKQKLLRMGSLNKQHLVDNVTKIWNEDDGLKALCSKLVETMPKRAQAVLKARGEAIKY